MFGPQNSLRATRLTSVGSWLRQLWPTLRPARAFPLHDSGVIMSTAAFVTWQPPASATDHRSQHPRAREPSLVDGSIATMAPGSPAHRVEEMQVPWQRQAAHSSQAVPQSALRGLTKALEWLTDVSLRSLQVCNRGLLEQTLQRVQVQPRWLRPRWRCDALRPAVVSAAVASAQTRTLLASWATGRGSLSRGTTSRLRLLDDVPLCVRATLPPAASCSLADIGSPLILDGWLRPFPGESDQESSSQSLHDSDAMVTSSSDYSDISDYYATAGPFERRGFRDVEIVDSSDSDVVLIGSTPQFAAPMAPGKQAKEVVAHRGRRHQVPRLMLLACCRHCGVKPTHPPASHDQQGWGWTRSQFGMRIERTPLLDWQLLAFVRPCGARKTCNA